jgi:hypothetical protein
MPVDGIWSRAPIVISDGAVERFWSHVVKSDGCWNWTAAKRGSGYGCIKVARRLISSHRFSYVLHFGDIPVGKIVCHKCDNRMCVRPDHLFVDTPKKNAHDMCAKGRHARTNGEGIANSKLTATQVERIFLLRRDDRITVRELAELFGVGTNAINRIVYGNGWRHVTDRLKEAS